MTSSSKQAKAILITGASGGIGSATTLACLRKGWHVFAAGRSVEKLEASLYPAMDESKIPRASVTLLEYDVCDDAGVKHAFLQIKQSSFSLFGLVNSAGLMQDAKIAMTSLANFNEQVQVNVTASFQHLQMASRLMTRQKAGSIVNLSSVVGLDGASGQVAYSTSKAAIEGMTKAAAKELAALNIRVNAVAPGFIDTALTQHYEKEKRAEITQNIALKRLGTASDVAATIVHLLSDEAEYITGQSLRVDGLMLVR